MLVPPPGVRVALDTLVNPDNVAADESAGLVMVPSPTTTLFAVTDDVVI